MKGKGKKLNKIKQPDYLLFIICVSLVLFILGIIGWLLLGAKQVEHTFKERVVMHVYLNDVVNYVNERDGLIEQLKKLSAVKRITYKDKEYAFKEWKKFGGEDFSLITKENILPESLEIVFKEEFVNPTEINTIKAVLEQSSIVDNVDYPDIFSQFKLLKRVTFYLFLIVVVLFIVAVVILSYLIKLIVYNNRFIIRTMSLVGASGTFISQPFERRALLNGFISSVMAIVGIFFTIRFTLRKIPDLRLIYNSSNFFIVCSGIVIVGIFISWISTRFTVRRYLNAAALEKFY